MPSSGNAALASWVAHFAKPTSYATIVLSLKQGLSLAKCRLEAEIFVSGFSLKLKILR